MKHTILVVEDSISVAEAIKNLLAISGYNVFMASNGKEGLQIMAENKPHLILSDIMMPIMDGIEFYKQVRGRSEWDQIPFVFLTAYGQKEDQRRAKKMGVDDYIVKPFASEDLLAIVEGKLARMEAILQVTFKQKLDYIRDEIVKALAHEFRTPITKIQGYNELILNKSYNDDDQLNSFAEQIRDSSSRLETSIEEFITMTRFELLATSQDGSNEFHKVDACVLAQIAVNKVRKLAWKKEINLHFTEPEEIFLIFVSQNDICEALYHLLRNAIKFSPNNGHVYFDLLLEAENVVFKVRDFGPGIDQDQLAKIFEKFYQINRVELEQQGIGLGLSIAKLATEKNKGTIQVDSRKGEGTTFQLAFPLCKASEEITD